MELHEIIRKRWEPGSILLVSEAENDFARNDILDLLDTIDKQAARVEALGAALGRVAERANAYQTCDDDCADCKLLAELEAMCRAALESAGLTVEEGQE